MFPGADKVQTDWTFCVPKPRGIYELKGNILSSPPEPFKHLGTLFLVIYCLIRSFQEISGVPKCGQGAD